MISFLPAMNSSPLIYSCASFDGVSMVAAMSLSELGSGMGKFWQNAFLKKKKGASATPSRIDDKKKAYLVLLVPPYPLH
jgi:hypothetical protein